MGIAKSGLLVRLGGIAVSCIVLACNSETTAPEGLIPVVPLRVGTTYSYHSSDTLIGAVAAGEPTAPDSDFTVRVVSDVADNTGAHWSALDAPQRMFGSAASASSYFANATDGLRSISSAFMGGSVAVMYLIFPYPAVRGALSQYGAVLSATDTVITVPAGTFHCLRYDSVQPTPGPPISWSIFIAPGTGVVQRSVMISAEYDRQGQFQLIGRHDRIYRLTAVSTP